VPAAELLGVPPMSKRLPYEHQDVAPETPMYWRSLEEKLRLADPSQQEALMAERAQEFTPEQTAADHVGRRGFMNILGASVALLGAAGCRRPVDKILPYAKMPEEVVLGVPTFYATAYQRRNEAVGLLVETHEGRPTKVEGNPEHPASLGATDLASQAAILDLYDPDRSGTPVKGVQEADWVDFEKELAAKLPALAADGGAKLRILTEPSISPSFFRLRELVKRKFPSAKFVTYVPASDSSVKEGTKLATGTALAPQYGFDKAKTIVSLDADFLSGESGGLRNTRLFAQGRRLRSASDDMSRLYQAEATHSLTGAAADHRLRIAASQVEKLALALAVELSEKHHVDLGELADTAKRLGRAELGPKAAAWVKAAAADLALHRGAGVVIAGNGQPARVHALAFALNKLLGNLDRTVVARPAQDNEESDNLEDIKDLAASIKAGGVDVLLVLGGNPVYNAPADLDFAGILKTVPFSVHLSEHRDATSLVTTWHLPRSHAFEAWGDLKSQDGTVSVQQPLIAPLRDTRSDLEVLALLADVPSKKGIDIVKATMKPFISSENAWKRALSTGIAVPAATAARTIDAIKADRVAGAFASAKVAEAPTKDNLEVVFTTCCKLGDGRSANNAWLQELAEPMTRIVWDNAALLSPTTAKELGIKSGDVVSLTRGNRSIEAAAWVQPGLADNTVSISLGWGRTDLGMVAKGAGFDAYPLRTTDAAYVATGVKLANTGKTYKLVQTQEHDSMEGRPVAIEATLAEYRKQPQFPELKAPPPSRTLPLWSKVDYTKGHRWGMTMDLNACTGCGACVVACQAENNILMVGKEQVGKGRELAWLRIDRYFLGDAEDPQVALQPVACQQCEEAPCENVCPVNATAHSSEGLNDMAYNRCIGTRYCANNCPYKVRRFNYLDFKSEFWFPEEKMLSPMKDPPKTVQMQFNPDVTVRMRGVMEKCTYCVQRIQRVKIETKRNGREIKDGEINTACAQACAAEALVFGDLNDPHSKVAKLTELDRRYRLLADLGTKPRTTYLGKVRNPNAELQGATATHDSAGKSAAGKTEKAG
jgi:Fe-S-cluster-containing dehydrogenase component